MALPERSIDDRTYDQLLAVLLKQLPVADWRDHNPSDPGITLLELMAWLGEMTLYRMNRTTAEHRARYLSLVIDLPEPATVPVTLTLQPPRATPATVKAGTLLASDFRNGARTIYETITDAVLVRPAGVPGAVQSAMVPAREWAEVNDELLGVSDGAPNQVFTLRGVGGDGHVLLDFVNNYGPSGPNPRVTVGGLPWQLQPFLRTGTSQVSVIGPAQHFMVDPIENSIRFGDGVFGTIPPLGQEIRCARYQVISGRRALVRNGELRHVLRVPAGSLILGATETLQVSHPDADGGSGFFGTGEGRFGPALEAFRRRDRLITADDFETVLLRDFNQLQAALAVSGLLSQPPQIARATALMNRKAPELLPKPGHVTIIVLSVKDWAVIADDTKPLVDKQAAVALDAPLEEKLRRFLDRRRLITTRLGFVAPTLVPVRIEASVVVLPGRSLAGMEEVVRSALRGFFQLQTGHFDGHGWPFGRNVFPAEIFRLIEGLEGVDHVSRLLLNGAETPVRVAEAELPVLQSVALAMARL